MIDGARLAEPGPAFRGIRVRDTATDAPGGEASEARSVRRYSVRVSLLGLAAACLVPAVLALSFFAYQNYQMQRERIARDTVRTARNLAFALDLELSAMASGLQVLASAPELAAGDLARFHRYASEVQRKQTASAYVLADRSGRQYLNTLRPYGEPLPTGGMPPELQHVFASRAPVLTGLFVGPVTQQPMIAMGVPVLRGDEVAYSLNIGLSPDRIGAILARQVMPEGWIADVLDGRGSIVARTHEAARFVGQKATPALVERVLADKEGTLEILTKEGIPVYAAFSHSSKSDWSVSVFAPKAELNAELYRSIGWVLMGTGVAFGVGLWFAAQLTSRVSGAIRGLVGPALSLGSGKPVAFSHSGITEAEAVGQAIVQASRMLEQTRHLAQHDPLTGLPNRRLFDELASSRIAEAHRKGGSLAVLAIDLDGFKEVNDRHGHAAGDLVLKTVAERILGLLRSSDVVARLGGDEFAVLLSDADLDSAMLVGRKLVAVLAEPYPDVQPAVSASIGVAMYPMFGRTATELCARADRALYEAKKAGKQRLVVDQ